MERKHRWAAGNYVNNSNFFSACNCTLWSNFAFQMLRFLCMFLLFFFFFHTKGCEISLVTPATFIVYPAPLTFTIKGKFEKVEEGVRFLLSFHTLFSCCCFKSGLHSLCPLGILFFFPTYTECMNLIFFCLLGSCQEECYNSIKLILIHNITTYIFSLNES